MDKSTGQTLGIQKFGDIERTYEGKWEVDPKHGNSYFVKSGEKAPPGWEDD